MVLPTKFRFIWRSSFKEEYIQKQELPVVAMFDNGSELNEQSYRGPSIDASYQVSVHLAKRFQRRRFFKLANQKQELPVVAMFVNRSDLNEHSL
jgi:hypothetical protein